MRNNKDISKMDTEEIFKELKSNVSSINPEKLSEYEKNLLVALQSAMSINQKLLIEQCVFFHKCIKKEVELINLGFDKFIYKDDIQEIIETLDKKNEKNIYFIELERFPRVIPREVQNKIKSVMDRNIFDKYYVLFTDYTKKTKKISENTNKDEYVRKDPIVFGTFSLESADTHIKYMGERVYYIADWVDEYCDLTLDRLLNEVPDKVKSLYSDNDIDMSLLDKLKNDEIGKFVYKDIMNTRSKKSRIILPLKDFARWLQNIFQK